MKQELDTIGKWLLKSSADPAAASLTVKGILMFSVPILLTLVGLAHISLGQQDLTNAVDSVVNVITMFLYLVAGVMTMWGALRKIFYPIYEKFFLKNPPVA